MARFLNVFLALGILFTASNARAEEADAGIDWSYLVDGGALPFFWGSAAVALGASTLLSPPESPRFFSPDEGGREPTRSTVPTYQVAVMAAFTPLLIAASGAESNLYHAKGAAEAIVSVAALTEVTKNYVGRHRPIYSSDASNADYRRSFFSLHASLTLAATTYAGLYLHDKLFAKWREPGQSFAWWEAPPLAALVAMSVYVPYTRVVDGRHHVSDVLVGAAIGATTAIAFYLYQDRRFHAARGKRELPPLTVIPTTNGLAVSGRW